MKGKTGGAFGADNRPTAAAASSRRAPGRGGGQSKARDEVTPQAARPSKPARKRKA
jgi:hypothetical protein